MTEKIPVLKRLFEYSNIFEQGFENEYSNTKIENRVFEKAMNRAPAPILRQAVTASAAPLIKPLIDPERELRCTVTK